MTVNTNRYQPVITVITIVFNGDLYLGKCIQSIINQTYDRLEYVVIDGGSTDGSLDIIRKYESEIDFWVSEPDKGIADAMNKGVTNASGEYVIFIHADDYLYTNTAIEMVVKHLIPTTDILIAEILFGNNLIKCKSRGFKYWLNLNMVIFHQGVVCRRSLFDEYGLFDVGLYISMDYDFFLRVYRRGVKAELCDEILAVMGDSGISSRSDWQSLSARFNEEALVHRKNCNSSTLKMFYHIYGVLYIVYRKLLYVSKQIIS